MLNCSFCEKEEKDVEKLISGNGVYICNECIDLCNDLIEQDPTKKKKKKKKHTQLDVSTSFQNITEYVVGQDDLVQDLLYLMNNYKDFLNGNNPNKESIFISGQSGTGKSFAVENVVNYLDYPYLKINASRLAPESYRGVTLNEVTILAKNKMNKKGELVIFFDECDKLFTKKSDTSADLISELLTYIEGESNALYRTTNSHATEPINTKNILFIFAGAFSNYKISSREDILAEFKDVQGATEFFGRISFFSKTNPLTKELISDIINSKNGSINYYKNKWTDIYHVKFDKKFDDLLLKNTLESPFGLRGVKSYVSNLDKTLFKLNIKNNQILYRDIIELMK